MKKYLDAALKLDLPERDVKNANIVNLWMFAWAITLVGATAIAEFAEDWQYFTLTVLFAIALHAGVTLVMIFKFKHLLSHMDELERKIQLEALALSSGAALGGCSVYSILENANLVAGVQINIIIMLLAFTYMGALVIGRVRFR